MESVMINSISWDEIVRIGRMGITESQGRELRIMNINAIFSPITTPNTLPIIDANPLIPEWDSPFLIFVLSFHVCKSIRKSYGFRSVHVYWKRQEH